MRIHERGIVLDGNKIADINVEHAGPPPYRINIASPKL